MRVTLWKVAGTSRAPADWQSALELQYFPSRGHLGVLRDLRLRYLEKAPRDARRLYRFDLICCLVSEKP